MADGVGNARLWWLLGLTDMRQRYGRSRLGQFWITLSTAAFVFGIGVVNAGLFRTSAADYVPYVATAFLVWGFMTGVLNEASTAFVQAAGFLRQQPLPKTLFVMRGLVRQGVILAHNLVILPVVWLAFGGDPGPEAFLAVPGLVVLVVSLAGLSLGLAVLATRFRDLPLLVQNLLQLAFFLTPVLWRPEQLPAATAALLAWNPFAPLLGLVAGPLTGQVPGTDAWALGVAIAVVSCTGGFLVFARFRARLVYWL
ncbi:ABC transporter permease [Alsobacter sp. R-9]